MKGPPPSRRFVLINIHFDQIHGPKAVCRCEALTDIVGLTVRKATLRNGTRAWCNRWVTATNIKGQMKCSIFLSVNTLQHLFHDVTDTVAINVCHSKHMNPALVHELTLCAIHFTKADKSHPICGQRSNPLLLRLEPFK